MLTSLIVTLNSVLPELSNTVVALIAKADIDKEITEIIIRLKVRSRSGRSPLIDGPSTRRSAIPAAQLARPLRLVVKRCT